MRSSEPRICHKYPLRILGHRKPDPSQAISICSRQSRRHRHPSLLDRKFRYPIDALMRICPPFHNLRSHCQVSETTVAQAYGTTVSTRLEILPTTLAWTLGQQEGRRARPATWLCLTTCMLLHIYHGKVNHGCLKGLNTIKA